MSLLLRNNGDGGTDGAAVTIANSGGASGDAFDGVTGAPTYASDAPLNGEAIKVAMGPTVTANYVTWSTKLGTISSTYGRFYFRMSALPSSTLRIMRFLSGSTVCCEFVLQSGTNKLGLKNTAGTDAPTAVPAAGGLSANTWYRVEFQISSFGTTTGAATWTVYAGNSTTPIGSASTSAANFGAASANSVRMGAVQGGDANASYWFDGFNVNDTALPGPDGGTTHSDAPTGTAVATGSVSESWAHAFTDDPTGTATATGSMAESWNLGLFDSPTGIAVVTGSLVEAHLHLANVTATATVSGARAESWAHTDTVAGTATATGSVSEFCLTPPPAEVPPGRILHRYSPHVRRARSDGEIAHPSQGRIT